MAGSGPPKSALLAYLVAKYTPDAADLSQAVHAELKALRAAAKDAGVPLAVEVFYRNRSGGMRALFAPDLDVQAEDCDAPFAEDPFITRAADPTWRIIPRALPTDGEALRDFTIAARRQIKEVCGFTPDFHIGFFFGHGFGPMGMFYARQPNDAARKRQDGRPDFLRLDELAHGLNSGQPLDLLVLKSCHLQLLETVYELQNSVRYLVGCQETAALSTWPWSDLMPILGTGGDVEAISRSLVDHLGEFLKVPAHRDNDTIGHVPYSAIRIGPAVAAFKQPLQWLVEEMRVAKTGLGLAELRSALEESRHVRPGGDPALIRDPALIDIGRLSSNLLALTNDGHRNLGTALRKALDEALVLDKSNQRYSGLSTYYRPPDGTASRVDFSNDEVYEAQYKSLRLKETRWPSMALKPLVSTHNGINPI